MKIAIVVLVIIVLILCYGIGKQNRVIQNLQTEKRKLNKKYDDLMRDDYALRGDLTEIEYNYNKLLGDMHVLQKDAKERREVLNELKEKLAWFEQRYKTNEIYSRVS